MNIIMNIIFINFNVFNKFILMYLINLFQFNTKIFSIIFFIFLLKNINNYGYYILKTFN